MVTENLCFAASHAPALQDFLVVRFGLDGSVSTLFAHLAMILAMVAHVNHVIHVLTIWHTSVVGRVCARGWARPMGE